MKKYLLTLLLILFIIPSVALASWWNPFSWKIFNRSSEVKIERPIAPPVNQIDTSNQTPKEKKKKLDQSTEIEKLKKEVTELKAKSETIKTTKPTITSKIINAIPQSPTPTNNEKKCGGITYQNGCSANEGTAEIYFYCSPLGEARCTDLDTLNKLTNGSLVFCNKKTYTACPIGYTLSCTVTGATCVSGKPAVPQPVVSSNGLAKQQRIDEMLKILD
ncbi:MAG: hypothetical protein NT094_01245 [Candidatus Staskawiczbacteria bacterium]|nr:hypothetical protein [Candidatus Staskawiczbacteria bacterium]